MVENAFYFDDRVAEAAAVGVPDDKLGELVAVVVSTKPEYHGKVKESELIELARKKSVEPHQLLAPDSKNRFVRRLPHFAVPVMVMIRSEPFGKYSVSYHALATL